MSRRTLQPSSVHTHRFWVHSSGVRFRLRWAEARALCRRSTRGSVSGVRTNLPTQAEDRVLESLRWLSNGVRTPAIEDAIRVGAVVKAARLHTCEFDGRSHEDYSGGARCPVCVALEALDSAGPWVGKKSSGGGRGRKA